MTEILKNEPMLASSGRIDKCPTPMGFYDKLPTTGTDKMTNARGGWARNFVVCIRSRTRSSNERDDDSLYYVVPVLRPLAIF